MTTSKGYPLTADQNAVVIKLKEIMEIEENNNFANGDVWDNASDMLDEIEATARQNDLDKYSFPTSVPTNQD